MKNPLIFVKNQLTEVKGRTLLIVIIVVVVLIIAGIFIFRGKENATLNAGQASRSSTLRAPSIQSTPGGTINDQAYIELQREANKQHAEQAIEKGESAVATVTNNQFLSELGIPETTIASVNRTPAKQEQENQAALAQYQQVYQEQLQKEKREEIERIRREEMQQQEVYQEAYESLMQAQAKSLMGQWHAPTQAYVKVEEPTSGPGNGKLPGGQPGSPPLYKAGDVVFGVMETSVDSDEPGPVLARVVSGPLDGAKLIGSFKRVEDQVFLEFSLLSAPNVAHSLPVKAVAIDPETARTALATDVDYHRLLRYSTLFASAFLQGVGEAVLASIQPNFSIDSNSSTLTVTNVQTTTKDQVLVGLGEVGTKMGEKLDPIFDKPPTVTLDAGTAVGLLFLQDFSLQPGSAMATAANAVQVIHQDNRGNTINPNNTLSTVGQNAAVNQTTSVANMATNSATNAVNAK